MLVIFLSIAAGFSVLVSFLLYCYLRKRTEKIVNQESLKEIGITEITNFSRVRDMKVRKNSELEGLYVKKARNLIRNTDFISYRQNANRTPKLTLTRKKNLTSQILENKVRKSAKILSANISRLSESKIFN